ncbi:MAG: hypothetical protein ACOZQL_13230 [Myxococcota bacterium]
MAKPMSRTRPAPIAATTTVIVPSIAVFPPEVRRVVFEEKAAAAI